MEPKATLSETVQIVTALEGGSVVGCSKAILAIYGSRRWHRRQGGNGRLILVG